MMEQEEKNGLDKKLQSLEKECTYSILITATSITIIIFVCIYKLSLHWQWCIWSLVHFFNLVFCVAVLISRTKLAENKQDLSSNRHVETLKQKIMKLRKENEVLKRQLMDSNEDWCMSTGDKLHPLMFIVCIFPLMIILRWS